MPNDLINLIPQDAEELAAFIEAARTLGGTSKAASSAINRYFGPVIVENWRRIWGKSEELKDAIPPERHTAPSPSILIPLVDTACQESRRELQDLWAALLANSMIDEGKKVRQAFISTLSKFDPPDVLVLRAIINIPQPTGWFASSLMTTNRAYISQQIEEIGLSKDEWESSCQNLKQLGCIEVAPNHSETIILECRPYPTSFGKQLVAACTAPIA